MEYYSIVAYCTILNTSLYSTVQYSTVQVSTILYSKKVSRKVARTPREWRSWAHLLLRAWAPHQGSAHALALPRVAHLCGPTWLTLAALLLRCLSAPLEVIAGTCPCLSQRRPPLRRRWTTQAMDGKSGQGQSSFVSSKG